MALSHSLSLSLKVNKIKQDFKLYIYFLSKLHHIYIIWYSPITMKQTHQKTFNMLGLVKMNKNLFFLISNLKVYWKNTAPYIGNVLKRQRHQEIKVQCSSNPKKEIQETEGKTKHHSRRVEKKKKNLNSRMDRSRSSKLLEFRFR